MVGTEVGTRSVAQQTMDANLAGIREDLERAKSGQGTYVGASGLSGWQAVHRKAANACKAAIASGMFDPESDETMALLGLRKAAVVGCELDRLQVRDDSIEMEMVTEPLHIKLAEDALFQVGELLEAMDY